MSRLTYCFGAFRLQPGEQRLLRDGEVVPLPPRVFDTLVALVERRGRLVDKEELLQAVWAGVFLLGIAAVAVFVGMRVERRSVDLPRIQSLAILPFRSVGIHQEAELFGLGMADALITRLSSVRSLVVRPTSAVVRYVGGEPEAVAVGRQLGFQTPYPGLPRAGFGGPADEKEATPSALNE